MLGNGESRRDLDLSSLELYYDIIGCNALHRDFLPKKLICCDRRMAVESLENPEISGTTVYVRDEWYRYFRKIKKNKNVDVLPDIPFHGDRKADHPDNWGSGPYALLVACKDYEEIYLSGFDLHSKNYFINNIYKGTSNYKEENSRPVDPSFWIYQISRIFEFYRSKKFYIINHVDWMMPKEWASFTNVKKLNFSSLMS